MLALQATPSTSRFYSNSSSPGKTSAATHLVTTQIRPSTNLYSSPGAASDSEAKSAIGDYIAHGLGFARSLSASTAFTSRRFSITAHDIADDSSTSSGTVRDITTLPYANASSLLEAEARNYIANSSNITIAYSGLCWDQWTQFWSLAAIIRTISPEVSTQTQLFTFTDTKPGSIIESYTTTTDSQVERWDNGSLETDFYTDTETIWNSETVTYTDSDVFTVITNFRTRSIDNPSCVLPSVETHCQSLWDEYGRYVNPLHSNSPTSTPPPCTQAIMAPDACDGLRSSFFYSVSSADVGWGGPPVLDDADAGWSQVTINGSITSTWPAHQSFGPGCTMGCRDCKFTAKKAKLLYWPVTLSASNMTHNASVTDLVTVVSHNTTFTSPTGRCQTFRHCPLRWRSVRSVASRYFHLRALMLLCLSHVLSRSFVTKKKSDSS